MREDIVVQWLDFCFLCTVAVLSFVPIGVFFSTPPLASMDNWGYRISNTKIVREKESVGCLMRCFRGVGVGCCTVQCNAVLCLTFFFCPPS